MILNHITKLIASEVENIKINVSIFCWKKKSRFHTQIESDCETSKSGATETLSNFSKFNLFKLNFFKLTY